MNTKTIMEIILKSGGVVSLSGNGVQTGYSLVGTKLDKILLGKLCIAFNGVDFPDMNLGRWNYESGFTYWITKD